MVRMIRWPFGRRRRTEPASPESRTMPAWRRMPPIGSTIATDAMLAIDLDAGLTTLARFSLVHRIPVGRRRTEVRPSGQVTGIVRVIPVAPRPDEEFWTEPATTVRRELDSATAGFEVEQAVPEPGVEIDDAVDRAEQRSTTVEPVWAASLPEPVRRVVTVQDRARDTVPVTKAIAPFVGQPRAIEPDPLVQGDFSQAPRPQLASAAEPPVAEPPLAEVPVAEAPDNSRFDPLGLVARGIAGVFGDGPNPFAPPPKPPPTSLRRATLAQSRRLGYRLTAKSTPEEAGDARVEPESAIEPEPGEWLAPVVAEVADVSAVADVPDSAGAPPLPDVADVAAAPPFLDVVAEHAVRDVVPVLPDEAPVAGVEQVAEVASELPLASVVAERELAPAVDDAAESPVESIVVVKQQPRTAAIEPVETPGTESETRVAPTGETVPAHEPARTDAGAPTGTGVVEPRSVADFPSTPVLRHPAPAPVTDKEQPVTDNEPPESVAVTESWVAADPVVETDVPAPAPSPASVPVPVPAPGEPDGPVGGAAVQVVAVTRPLAATRPVAVDRPLAAGQSLVAEQVVAADQPLASNEAPEQGQALETARQGAPKQDAQWQDRPWQDPPSQDAPRQDAPRQDGPWPDRPNQNDSSQNYPKQHDSSQHDPRQGAGFSAQPVIPNSGRSAPTPVLRHVPVPQPSASDSYVQRRSVGTLDRVMTATDDVGEVEWTEPVSAAILDIGRRIHTINIVDVPVLRGPQSADRARELGARAFTADGVVHLPAEAGSLSGTDGAALLAHELTHVAQQRLLGGSLPPEDSAEGRLLEMQALAVEAATRGVPVPALVHLTTPTVRPQDPLPQAGQAQQMVELAQNFVASWTAPEIPFDEPENEAESPSPLRINFPVPSAISSTASGASGVQRAIPGGVDFAQFEEAYRIARSAQQDQTVVLAPEPAVAAALPPRAPEFDEKLARQVADWIADNPPRHWVDLDVSAEVEELTRIVYERLHTRLRADLLVQRERSGLLLDHR